MMPKLVLNAPSDKARDEGKRSFEQTIAKRTGEGYILTPREHARIRRGWKVIVIDRKGRKQAEGTLIELVLDGREKGLPQRYDVRFELDGEIREIEVRMTRRRRCS